MCLQVSKYRKVAEKLASLLQHNLATCLRAWRDASDQAHINMLRAERHAATVALHKLLPAWLETAQELKQERQQGEVAADRFRRRHVARLVLQGWRGEMQALHEQRAGLWRVMLLLLQLEREGLLQTALQGWQQQARQQVALRECVTGFVNKRRLECLSEFLTLWHHYTVAMRTDSAALIPAALAAAASPAATAATAAAGSAAYYSVDGRTSVGDLSPGKGSSRIAAAADVGGGFAGPVFSPAAQVDQAVQLPAGLLPVTGGPGSPVLGPRSAHQDRRLARRLAAMGGGAAEVRGLGCRGWGCAVPVF